MKKIDSTSRVIVFNGEGSIDNMIKLCLSELGCGKVLLLYDEDSHALAVDIAKILGNVGMLVRGVAVNELDKVTSQTKMQENRMIVAIGGESVADQARKLAFGCDIPYILIVDSLPSIGMMKSKSFNGGRLESSSCPHAIVCDPRVQRTGGASIASCIGELCATLVDCLEFQFWSYANECELDSKQIDFLFDKIKGVIDILPCTDDKARVLTASILEVGEYLSEVDCPATPTSIFGEISSHIGNLGSLQGGIREMIGAMTISKMYAQMLKLDNIPSPHLDINRLAIGLAKSVGVSQAEVLNQVDLSDNDFYKQVLLEYHSELYDRSIQVATTVRRACKEFRRAMIVAGVELGKLIDSDKAIQIAKYTAILSPNCSILSLLYR